MSRKTPEGIARILRQEVGFGCAKCGNPILQYHHIVPWADLQHYDPKHMVALCPNHHDEAEKLPREHSYRLKDNPINIRNGRIHGLLGGQADANSVRVGNFTFETDVVLIKAYGNPMVSFRRIESTVLLDINVPDEFFWPRIRVRANEMSASTAGFWDIAFRTNYVSFRERKGEQFLSIDFRRDPILLTARMTVGGTRFEATEGSFGIRGGGGMRGGSVHLHNIVCAIGEGKVHPPNYAMIRPEALHISN